jgi:hypothetical protein
VFGDGRLRDPREISTVEGLQPLAVDRSVRADGCSAASFIVRWFGSLFNAK